MDACATVDSCLRVAIAQSSDLLFRHRRHTRLPTRPSRPVLGGASRSSRDLQYDTPVPAALRHTERLVGIILDVWLNKVKAIWRNRFSGVLEQQLVRPLPDPPRAGRLAARWSSLARKRHQDLPWLLQPSSSTSISRICGREAGAPRQLSCLVLPGSRSRVVSTTQPAALARAKKAWRVGAPANAAEEEEEDRRPAGSGSGELWGKSRARHASQSRRADDTL